MTGQTLRLAHVLTPVSRTEEVIPNKTYNLLGAHWYAKGLYFKETKDGSEIKASTLYRVEQGDFVYNRLFAWKGSFALASARDRGCHVSNEFPCFRVDTSKLEPEYLAYYFSLETTWTKALALSSGGTPTSRNRLKEDKFLAMEIPAISLSEQQRIVALINALSDRVEEAKRLRKEATDEIALLHRSMLSSDENNRVMPMSALVLQREPDVIVEAEEVYQFAGVYCFGKGVFKGQAKTGIEFAYPRLTRLHTGDFIYPKLMAWEGALGTC